MVEPAPPDEIDGQDSAEIFDETNITEDGEDIATPDVERDVYDVTTALDDADPDDALNADDDFDPDDMDEAEYEEVVLAEEDLDESRLLAGDDADRVRDDDLRPADLESGSPDEDDPEEGDDTDERLDEAREEAYPASHPPAIRRRSD